MKVLISIVAILVGLNIANVFNTREINAKLRNLEQINYDQYEMIYKLKDELYTLNKLKLCKGVHYE